MEGHVQLECLGEYPGPEVAHVVVGDVEVFEARRGPQRVQEDTDVAAQLGLGEDQLLDRLKLSPSLSLSDHDPLLVRGSSTKWANKAVGLYANSSQQVTPVKPAPAKIPPKGRTESSL